MAIEKFEQAARLLGGRRVLGKVPRTAVAAVELVREGMPYRSLTSLRSKLHATLDELSQALDLPKRTLERRASQRARLSVGESERLFRLARVVARAEDVFDDLEKASA